MIISLHSIESAALKQKQPILSHQAEEQEIANTKSLSGKSSFKKDFAALVTSLKACAKHKDLWRGRRLHADICKEGLLGKNIYVGNALVNMYVKCGAFDEAQEVLEGISVQDVVSWNALISGYAQQGHGYQALYFFEQMQREGVCPNAVTFTCALKACGNTGASEKGEQIHADIVRLGWLEVDAYLGNALVDMYAKCAAFENAHDVLDQLQAGDIIPFNALIAGYVQHNHCYEALNCYEHIQDKGLSPNSVTFISILKACSIVGAAEKGEVIHNEVLSKGLLKDNITLGNALVDMYAKCGILSKAQEVFDELTNRNIISWNALITGYSQHGHGKKALIYFQKMQDEGLSPNIVTYVCVLTACGSVGALKKGEEIHSEILNRDVVNYNTALGNALIDMYAKCGALTKAQEVFDELCVQDVVSWNALIAGYIKSGAFWKAQELFDELPIRDVVSWSAMIAGYAENGEGCEALSCFEQMRDEGIAPNTVTFVNVLKACGSLGMIKMGECIHAEVIQQELLDKDISLGSALVGMYAKLGSLEKSQHIFDEILTRDVILWSAIIGGYAQTGNATVANDLFNQMRKECILPDLLTFTVVLNACSHSGLVDEGQVYFDCMSTNYGLIPDLEHYTSMVDLYARAGHFDEAIRMIEKMRPLDASSYFPLWLALLGACRKWDNLTVGRLAFEHAIQLEGKDSAAYILMRNIYVTASMGKEANKVEVLRLQNEAWMLPGRSMNLFMPNAKYMAMLKV